MTRRRRIRNIQLLLLIVAFLSIGYASIKMYLFHIAREEAQSQKMVSSQYVANYQQSLQSRWSLSDPFGDHEKDNQSIDYLARVKIPKINVDEPLYMGTSDDILQKGFGLLEGSDIPANEKGYSSIIAGHRSYAGISQFLWDLDKVSEGDFVYVERDSVLFTYQVRKIRILAVDEVDLVTQNPEETWISVVTCDPKWTFSSRYGRLVVEAILISQNQW